MKKVGFLTIVMTLLWMLTSACGETLHVSTQGMSLTEALAISQDGDTIELAEGTYTESTETFPLRVEHSVTICAKSGAEAVIDAPAFTAALKVERDGVTLQDLDIRMRRIGVYVTGDDLVMRDCRVTLADPSWRTSSCGVWLGGVQRACFTVCAFTGCSIAMAGPPISDTSAGKPVLTGLFEVGDDPVYFTSHTITDCTVNERPLLYLVGQRQVDIQAGAGEVILADCKDVQMQNVDVSDSSMGMILAYCEGVRLTDCKADRCGLFGLYLAYCGESTLNGCTVDGTNHGIDLRASHQITVRDCAASNCEQGIFFSHVDDSVILNCTVAGTGQGYFFAGGNHNMVVKSAATDCENGIHVQEENGMLITDCVLEGNTTCAVRLDGSPTIFVNNVLRNNWVGVMAYGKAAFTMTGNSFEDSKSCGLYLRDIAYSRIVNNTFAGSAASSVQAYGEMSGTVLNENTFDIPLERME